LETAVSPLIDDIKVIEIHLEEIEGKCLFPIFSPLLYQLSYPAKRGLHIQPATQEIGNVIC
jgi:hypothetical protein